MSRPRLSLMAVVTVVAAVVGVATAVPAPEPEAAKVPKPVRAPVALTRGVCPDPGGGAGSQTRVAMAAPGPVGSGGSSGESSGPIPAGRAELVDLGGSGSPHAILARASATALAAADPEPPLVATAARGLAPGFAASMVTRVPSGDLRGLLGTPCLAPGTDFWFVGSGAVVGQRGRVYLTNPETAPAVADVTLYGPDGPIDAPAGRGVSVAAGGQEVLLLDALAPEQERLAVHVQVHQGRLSAALRDQQVAGLDPRGSDWVQPAAAPARRVVVPGVPGGAGERRLQVLVPGRSDAIVRVRLLGVDGSFAPAGLDVVESTAGAVGDVDLAPQIKGEEVALELSSDVPITAGLLARVGGTDGRLVELGYGATALPLTAAAPGVVPDVRRGATTRSLLTMAAPGKEATVEVAPMAPATGTPVTVEVPPGRQVSLDLSEVSEDAAFAVTVVPTPGSGPVVVSRAITEAESRGPLLTSSPVLPGRFTVPVPAVVADLSTGLRSRD
ncbi:MAG: DUF5719 family protein [Actinomycetes bacterium]